MTNYGPNRIRDSNTSFERSLSKLSENQKINEIGSSEQKLRLFEIGYTESAESVSMLLHAIKPINAELQESS